MLLLRCLTGEFFDGGIEVSGPAVEDLVHGFATEEGGGGDGADASGGRGSSGSGSGSASGASC